MMIKINKSKKPEVNENIKKELISIKNSKKIRAKKEFQGKQEYISSLSLYKPKPIEKIDQLYFQKIIKDFNNKCSFCEVHVEEYDLVVEKFRPTLYYPWLTYEWDNLYVSCKKCNMIKGANFPVEGSRAETLSEIKYEKYMVIDPGQENPALHLYFHDNGTVTGKTNKGKLTIDLFNLNRTELVEKRKKEYSRIIEYLRIIETINSDLVIKNLISLNHRGQVRQKLIELMTQDTVIRKNLLTDENTKTALSKLFDEIITLENFNSIRIKFSDIELKEDTLVSDKKNYNSKFLKEIIVNNVRGVSFRHSFNYVDKIPYLMILGENGVGKTSILQTISLALVGESEDFRIKNIDYSTSFNNEDSDIGNVEIIFENTRLSNIMKFSSSEKKYELNEDNVTVAAYGSTRLVSKNKKREKTKKNVNNIINIFSTSKYSYYLPNPQTWLREENDIKKVNDALIELFTETNKDEQNTIEIKFEKSTSKFFIKIRNEFIGIEDLSSGYRSVILLILDIMRAICLNDLEDLGRFSKGIVIIDEIDAHLHPSWKIKIVDNLKKIFPYIQFIMTTHDPLCLRGLERDEILIIQNNGIIERNLFNQSTMKIDQILTSNLFGLSSTLESNLENYLNKDKIDQRDRIDEKKAEKELKYYGLERKQQLAFEIIDNELKKKKTDEEILNDSELVDKILRVWGLKND